jgi:hypothetical protein
VNISDQINADALSKAIRNLETYLFGKDGSAADDA